MTCFLDVLPRQTLSRAMQRYVVRRILGPRGRVAAWRALGCHIEPGVRLGPGTRMRKPENVRIGSGTAIVGVTWIDAWNTVTIGRRCLLNDQIDLLTGSHDVDSPHFTGKSAPILIGDYAWLPLRIVVLPGVTIGRGAVIATGSVVVTDVNELTVVGGNPARVIGKRADADFRYVPSQLGK